MTHGQIRMLLQDVVLGGVGVTLRYVDFSNPEFSKHPAQRLGGLPAKVSEKVTASTINSAAGFEAVSKCCC